MDRIVVTLATQSHLPYARALAMSVRQSNPDIAVYVLLVDGDGKQPDGNEPFNTITLAQLPDQAIIGRMAFYYTPFEFCQRLKAYLSTYVMCKLKPRRWLYLDSDIMICSSLEPIWQQLESASILLTPHCTRPTPDPGASEREAVVIKYGVFNAGLMGLSKCQETSEFLRWFANRLSSQAFYDDLANVDQTWLTMIPCLFPSSQICRLPGVNLGHWNLHEQKLSDDGMIANGSPVICVHFSGWDFAQPQRVSRHAPAYLDPGPTGWEALAQKYCELLKASGMGAAGGVSYLFSHFSDGREITPRMRRAYAVEVSAGTAPKDPFNSADHFYSRYAPRFYSLRKRLPKSFERFLRTVVRR